MHGGRLHCSANHAERSGVLRFVTSLRNPTESGFAYIVYIGSEENFLLYSFLFFALIPRTSGDVGGERSGQTSQRRGQDGTAASRGDSGGLHQGNGPPSQ